MIPVGGLQVQNLSKTFYRYKNDAQRFWSCLFSQIQPEATHEVLKDLSFTIEPGQAIGIIGHNGAGKSTLLKMLTGTLQPTRGDIQVVGKVAAILELGMGFNPDQSARENVRHVSGLMGISQAQIEELMPSIMEFSEIGPYFDQPMRVYSSGMQVRVAFALATAVRPDILIVDEALSVGDTYFQHKSFDRIRQYRDQGTTLLFVSHDPGAVLALCDRCLLINQGQLVMDAEPSVVMDYYNALIAEKDQSVDGDKSIAQESTEHGVRTRSGTGAMHLDHIELRVNHHAAEIMHVGQHVTLRVEATSRQDLKDVVFGYMIKDKLGQPVFGTNTFHIKHPIPALKTGQRVVLEFDFPVYLGENNYSITTSFSSGKDHLTDNYEWIDRALVFNVVNLDQANFVGSSWIPPTSVRIQTL